MALSTKDMIPWVWTFGGTVIDQGIAVDASNKVGVSGDKKNKVNIVAKQGLFKGKVVNPVDGKPVKFTGVVLQRFNAASGYFLGAGLGGRASMAP